MNSQQLQPVGPYHLVSEPASMLNEQRVQRLEQKVESLCKGQEKMLRQLKEMFQLIQVMEGTSSDSVPGLFVTEKIKESSERSDPDRDNYHMRRLGPLICSSDEQERFSGVSQALEAERNSMIDSLEEDVKRNGGEGTEFVASLFDNSGKAFVSDIELKKVAEKNEVKNEETHDIMQERATVYWSAKLKAMGGLKLEQLVFANPIEVEPTRIQPMLTNLGVPTINILITIYSLLPTTMMKRGLHRLTEGSPTASDGPSGGGFDSSSRPTRWPPPCWQLLEQIFSHLFRVKFLHAPRVQTPLKDSFSTTSYERKRDNPETLKDPCGFAVKFCTVEDLEQMLQEAQCHWLRLDEICMILHNYQRFLLTPNPPDRPPAISLFLFDWRAFRYFHIDVRSVDLMTEFLHHMKCSSKPDKCLILIGSSKSEKGTQSPIIRNEYCLCYSVTSVMLRAMVKAEEVMDKGKLVSNDLVVDVIDEADKKSSCQKGFILVGFLKTVAQALELDKMLEKKGVKIDKVLYFIVDDVGNGLMFDTYFDLDFDSFGEKKTRIIEPKFSISLTELLDESKVGITVYSDLEVEITRIQHDSRVVSAGDLFMYSTKISLPPLGNRALNVFASIVACVGKDASDVGLYSWLGRAVFVTCIVVGAVFFFSVLRIKVQIDKKCFIRDICFFLLVILSLSAILLVGEVTLAGAIMFVCIHLVYAFVVAAKAIFKNHAWRLKLGVVMTLLLVKYGSKEGASVYSLLFNSNKRHGMWVSHVTIYSNDALKSSTKCQKSLSGWNEEDLEKELPGSSHKIISLSEMPPMFPRQLSIPIIKEERGSKVYAMASTLLAPIPLAFLWNIKDINRSCAHILYITAAALAKELQNGSEVAKTGLGSSAAMTTVVVSTFLHYLEVVNFFLSKDQHQQKDSAYIDLEHVIAQSAHYMTQGKFGSWIDVSFAIYGSQCYIWFSLEVFHSAKVAVQVLSLEDVICAILKVKCDHETTKFSMVGVVRKWQNFDPQKFQETWRKLSESNSVNETHLNMLGKLAKDHWNKYKCVIESCSKLKPEKWMERATEPRWKAIVKSLFGARNATEKDLLEWVQRTYATPGCG